VTHFLQQPAVNFRVALLSGLCVKQVAAFPNIEPAVVRAASLKQSRNLNLLQSSPCNQFVVTELMQQFCIPTLLFRLTLSDSV
jgi:hypothetical protein